MTIPMEACIEGTDAVPAAEMRNPMSHIHRCLTGF